MDSRERVFLALNHEEPDRVPVDFWASTGTWNLISRSSRTTREEFQDANDVDLRYIEGPTYIGPPLRQFADGTDEDIWGVLRRTARVEVQDGAEEYKEVAFSPLSVAATLEEIESHDHWPSADWFDYSRMAEAARVSLEDVMLLQVRNQLQAEPEAGCTSLALSPTARAGPWSWVRRVENLPLLG